MSTEPMPPVRLKEYLCSKLEQLVVGSNYLAGKQADGKEPYICNPIWDGYEHMAPVHDNGETSPGCGQSPGVAFRDHTTRHPLPTDRELRRPPTSVQIT